MQRIVALRSARPRLDCRFTTVSSSFTPVRSAVKTLAATRMAFSVTSHAHVARDASARHALQALHSAQAVCFDVDSTVITVEAIDEFAAFAGKKEQVAAMTAAAMGGSVRFEDALAARLGLIQPTAALLAGFLAAHPFTFTPGVRELVAGLRQRGTDVYLVSGGFTQMIYPVADTLGVPRTAVYANTILFDRCVMGLATMLLAARWARLL